MRAPASPTRARFGVFELDADSGELRKDGVAVRIAPQPLAVLQLLVARAGAIVTREDLVRHVWGTDTFVDFDRGLNFCIAQVRAALGDDTAKPTYVQTLPKRGYRFIAPVSRDGVTPDGAAVEPAAFASAGAASARRGPRPSRILVYAGSGLIVGVLLLLLALYNSVDVLVDGLLRSLPGQARTVAVAVLPFQDLTPPATEAGADAAADRFSDGLTDELIGTLGRAAPTRFMVIARTSVMKYRNTNADIRDIGRELHVQYIVEGSVRRQDSWAQAEARLVEVSTRQTVWSGKIRQVTSGEFDLQTSLATTIAASVKGYFVRPVDSVPPPPDTNTAAGERFVNGRYLLRKGDPDSLARSADEFRDAIRQDPKFAAAHAGLADALLAQVLTGVRSAREVADEARQAATQAVALDDRLPDTLIAKGLVHLWIDWNPEQAEQQFRLALVENPSHAAAHHDLAWALLAQAEIDEAVTEIKRAFELDPLSTRASLDIGWIYLRARKYDDAIAHCRRTLDLEPNHPGAQGCLEQGYRKTGRLADAWTLVRRALPTSAAPGDDARAGLQRVTEQRVSRMVALANASDDRTIAASAASGSSASGGAGNRRRYVSPYQIATLYATLGDADEAFRWLERAFEEHDNSLVLLPVDPEWDGVRHDPRLTRLIARVRDAATAARRACGADPRPPRVPA